jgi:hypothetical protein
MRRCDASVLWSIVKDELLPPEDSMVIEDRMRVCCAQGIGPVVTESTFWEWKPPGQQTSHRSSRDTDQPQSFAKKLTSLS